MTAPPGAVRILRRFAWASRRILRANERFPAKALLSITFYSNGASVAGSAVCHDWARRLHLRRALGVPEAREVEANQQPPWTKSPDMKAAIPTFENRISPLFDTAQHLVLVDVENARELRRAEHSLSEAELVSRARRVAGLGVDVLICGAISCELKNLLQSAGVEVMPQICGPVEDILAAFISGELADTSFLMPGHRKFRRQQESRRPTAAPEASRAIGSGLIQPRS